MNAPSALQSWWLSGVGYHGASTCHPFTNEGWKQTSFVLLISVARPPNNSLGCQRKKTSLYVSIFLVCNSPPADVRTGVPECVVIMERKECERDNGAAVDQEVRAVDWEPEGCWFAVL